MTMTSLGIEDAPEPDRRYARDRRDDHEWPKPLLGVLAVILFGLLCWLAGDTINQVRANAKDITTLQQQFLYIRESQKRTEDSLSVFNALQQQLVQVLQQQQQHEQERRR